MQSCCLCCGATALCFVLLAAPMYFHKMASSGPRHAYVSDKETLCHQVFELFMDFSVFTMRPACRTVGAVVHSQIDSCSGCDNPTSHGCIKEKCLIKLPASETFMRFLAVRRCADGRVQPVSTLSLLTRGGQAARDTCGQGALQPHCSRPPVSQSTLIHVTVCSELQRAGALLS